MNNINKTISKTDLHNIYICIMSDAKANLEDIDEQINQITILSDNVQICNLDILKLLKHASEDLINTLEVRKNKYTKSVNEYGVEFCDEDLSSLISFISEFINKNKRCLCLKEKLDRQILAMIKK